MQRAEILKAVVVTAEMMGHEITPAAAEGIARELSEYSAQGIATALKRCSRELSGRLTLAAILERLPGQHPGPDEAWALCPHSESDTAVWTDQIATAFGVALPLLEAGDDVAARMAFRDAYKREVAAAGGALPKWSVSLGHDPYKRAATVVRAVELGRLPGEYAQRILPAQYGDTVRKLAPGGASLRELVAEVGK